MEPIKVELREVNGQKKAVFTNVIPTAEQYDEMIEALGRTRGAIEPPVPADLPSGHAVTLHIEDAPRAEIGRELDGSSVLMLRHSRFGWLGFRFAEKSREWLIEGLIADAQNAQQKPNPQ
ncbi:hypothetical protein J2W32_000346 [Variovorax boronicumulans]|uniref:Uncharacterized protein n=1 Tax=Variovorax boronicumulans TaxID=436515 RepID=A0AAW8CLL6_9BURK|nr:hypothetical protein [Variovorax boronicumulans]MDP9891249.1 hypothetical protein [Variovorax boronicumulans]MDQ0051317.1 hypothetical protein [Variovorax boronicumulans]